MKILKFGGTSVGRVERIRSVVAIIRNAAAAEPVAVVVSAFSGVTDELLAAARTAASGEPAWSVACDALAARHHAAVRSLAPPLERDALVAAMDTILAELRERLHGVSLLKECPPRTLDVIASCGERMSSLIVAAALRSSGMDAQACDARPLIVTDSQFGRARVRDEVTHLALRGHFASHEALQVLTGFIGATEAGETTTLGRGGSDYTAAILGAALDASCIEIWTDVDGVMSADPRLVPAAFPLASLGYDELMELSHFGAKVIYPPTVLPARRRGIPLVIRNTMNPAFPGTRIAADSDQAGAARSDAAASGVRGITSISRVALLRLEGDGMVGVPGIAMRLFGALAREGINVILISQASSEHSICFAVEPESAGVARDRLHEEFSLERKAGLIDDVTVEDDACLIAAVGSGMREQPGVAGRIFSVLGARGVNVRAIAQGSSELNITLAASRADEACAVRAIHAAFFEPADPAAEIFLAGIGRVGGALLSQIAARSSGARLQIAGVAGSTNMLIDAEGIDPRDWRERLASGARAGNLSTLAEAACAASGVRIFVDATAFPEAGAHYEKLLAAGVAVVTANKLPLSRELALWRRLDGRLYHEATVGAGLPVISTLEALVRTGDRILRIDGALSGTLGFLAGRVEAGIALSAALREAQEAGLTEPDPREDLSGMDVARKALILARVAGFALEPSDVHVDPLPKGDAALARRVEAALSAGSRLRYLAVISKDGARVGLAEVDASHPCAALLGPDNLIAFTTARYAHSPLVVRGPGAGPEVTAAGLFADILRAAATRTS